MQKWAPQKLINGWKMCLVERDYCVLYVRLMGNYREGSLKLRYLVSPNGRMKCPSLEQSSRVFLELKAAAYVNTRRILIIRSA